MAHLTVPFDERISRGITGGATFATDVVRVNSGFEVRNQTRSLELNRWDAAHHARLPAIWRPLQKFFRIAAGRRNTFDFKDLTDYQVATGEGVFTQLTATTFQMWKRYTVGSDTYDRKIQRPVQSTAVITGGTTPSVDYATGIVTVAAGTPTSFTAEFWTPCRFDTDEMVGRIIDRHGEDFIVGWGVDTHHRSPVVKSISVALKAHFTQAYQNVATCWKITLANEDVKAFTDHDQDILFESVTYLASSGYTASSVSSNDALAVDNLEVQGMLSSPSITEADLHAGLWDFARVEIFLVNWRDLTQGRLVQRVGWLGEISTDRGRFGAELRGLTQAYSRVIGELTGPSCLATLGDERCQVDMGPFTFTGTLTGVNEDNTTLYDTGRTEPGPAGGVAIDNVHNTNPVRIDLDGSIPGLYAGMLVVISEIVGQDVLNSLAFVRNPVSEASFFIDVDGSGLPSYVSGGIVTPLGSESGYFDHGVITFTSGLNDGLSMEVKQYTEGQMILHLPMPYQLEVGDTYSITKGCDKQLNTCKDVFDNVVNFRGFPYLPGIDKVIQVGRR